MKTGAILTPKKVLVFNGRQVLIAIVRSINTAAELSGGNLQSVSFACSGKYIATNGFYFRLIHPDVEIEISDLGTLKLKDYDKMCGDLTRRYNSCRNMTRQRKRLAERRRKRTKTASPKVKRVLEPA